ncbi:MAG TPA: hypothetical protein VMF61_13250 [Candidatus Acidoferrales bacterium]|nr:hypothetical protein [Candidatus Acidoferrales bacterium]
MSSVKPALHFGPRLVAAPTGSLRAAVVVRPRRSIESAKPLPGEPGSVYERALEQHAVLVKTLEYFGVETVVLDAHADDPYEPAVTDAAIAFEDGAVMMRPTAMSRRGESDRLEAEFERIDVPLAGHIAGPGLLDGSDVVLVGSTAFVGASARGNALGRTGFAHVATAHGYSVVEVPYDPSVPALSCVLAGVAPDTVVLAGSKVDRAPFAGFKTILLEIGEELAAGVLVLGERHVIADRRYRTAFSTMRRAGIVVEGLDLYDFAKIGITPSMLAMPLKRE